MNTHKINVTLKSFTFRKCTMTFLFNSYGKAAKDHTQDPLNVLKLSPVAEKKVAVVSFFFHIQQLIL